MKFAEIKMVTFMELINVEVGDIFVSSESIGRIERILKLKDKSEEELRAIRNTVVKTITEEFIEPLEEEENYKEAYKYMNKISGITAVIDQAIWNTGAEV